MTTPRLLVIDDDDMVLTYLSRTLSHRYTIMTRQDPKAAIDFAAVELPDLILCDIDMPDMDGGAVCAALAENPVTARIPFVYLTAMVSPSEVVELQGFVGGRPGVAKRASMQELIATIDSQLKA